MTNDRLQFQFLMIVQTALLGAQISGHISPVRVIAAICDAVFVPDVVLPSDKTELITMAKEFVGWAMGNEKPLWYKSEDWCTMAMYKPGDAIIVIAGPSTGRVGYVRRRDDDAGYVAVILFHPATNQTYDIDIARENLIKG